jgi:hypothetical protein
MADLTLPYGRVLHDYNEEALGWTAVVRAAE